MSVVKRLRVTFFLFPSDGEKNLNRQEELFVEDPQNAHLFDVEKGPQNGTKRTTDGPVSSAKRKKEDKPEKDEVCKSLHLNIANQINLLDH